MKSIFSCFLILLCCAGSGFGQAGKTVSGSVKSSDTQTPIEGASVVIRGTTIGAITNAQGVFTIRVPDVAVPLLVSAIGYDSSVVSITSDSLTVVLTRGKGNQLNEVVVVAYGTQRRENLTSAVTQVNTKDFNAGGARNALDLVQGKVPGLTITRTQGTNPNSGVNIQLRSVASIGGSNSPLVVIDGVPGGNLDLLQQSDIESITVLKDGSAAAIYGTRANGGVILVTTKRGGGGEPRYSYNGYVRKEYLYRYPKVLSASEYRQKIADGDISDDNDKGSSTDWFDELINHNNITHYHNLAVTGGDAKTNYRASLYYSNLEGIARANSREQYGVDANIYHKALKDRLTMQVLVKLNYNRANLQGGGNWEDALFRDNPTQSPYDSTNPGGYWNDNQITNVVSRLAQQTYTREQQTSLAQFRSTLSIIKGLNGTVTGSVQRDQYVDNQFYLLNSQPSQNDGDLPGGGYAYKGTNLAKDYLFEGYLDYTSSFSKDHTIKAIAGYSYQYHNQESFEASNKGFSADETGNNDLGAGTGLGQGLADLYSDKFDNTLISFFGRLNYSYRDKYLAEFVLRREGSTLFGENNRWGNFPAVSLGWQLSRENFMQDIKAITNLKVRAGYGVTGNQGFDITTTYPFVILGTGGYYLYPDGSWRQTYGPTLNYNPDLRWERKKEINLGLDFGLFKNRLTGSFDYFDRKTDGLVISSRVQQPSNIATNTLLNVGKLGSNGVELALSGSPVQSRNFNWRVDMTASHARTKLLKYTNGNYLGGGDIGGYGALGAAYNYIYPGDYIGQFYGKRFAGFDADGKWLFYDKTGKPVSSSQVSNDDQTQIGNAIPKYYASLTNTLSYKNLSLRFFLRGKFGYNILNTLDISYGNKYALPNNVLKTAFTTYGELNDTYQYSDYYLQKGNFVKLDEVTFSYNIPFKQVIKSMSVYVTGTNLWLITKYKGNDPDFVDDTGLYPSIDGRSIYPSTHSFLLGVNMTF